MYLRTKKMYQPGRRRVHLFTLRWLWLWILTPLVGLAGWWVLDNVEQLGPPVRAVISEHVAGMMGGMATLVAPTPLPTADPSARLTSADALWEQGAIGQAIEEYAVILANAPNNAPAHARYAYGLILERQTEAAVTAAERAITADPFNSDAWAVYSLALGRSGQYARAIASGLQALSLNPGSARALAFMAEAYLGAGLPSLASERINQALSIDEESAEAHFVRGLWNLSVNFDYPAARADFEMARDFAPNLPNAMVEMAWVDWAQGNYDVGLDLLEQVVEVNPNHLDALYALGYFHFQVYGNPNKAADYLSRCLLIAPTNVACLNYRATVQLGTGDVQGAAASYQAIIDAGTTNPVYYLRAGRTYANLGDCRRATPLLRIGRELESDLPAPNQERITVLDDLLLRCGAPTGAAFADAPLPSIETAAPLAPEVTGTPLLVPLGGG